MKKKLAKSLYLISLAAVPISIVSCSSNDDSNASSTDFETKVEKLFKEEKLIFKFKTPTITKELFEKYKKDNNKEIKKAFELYKDPSLGEEFDFSILSISDNSKEEIDVEFNVFDVINKNEKAKIKKTISVSFSSAQVYLNNVYKKIVKSKFQLKKQYRKTKLIEIIKNISTPKDFIDNYLEQDVYNDFLGINLELIIPSQSINFKNDFKINMMVEYELDKKLKPQNPSQPTLELDKEQISPITIFNQSDLNENKLKSFATDYIGKLFL